MKKILLCVSLLILSLHINAQVGINTTDPDVSSILEMSATDKGLLIPRVALQGLTDVMTVANPANSLLVFNDTAINDVQIGYYYWSTPLNKWIKVLNELDKPGVLFATFDSSKTDIKTTSFNGNKSFNYSNITFNTIVGASITGTDLTLPTGDYIIESIVNIGRDSFNYTMRIDTTPSGVMGTIATVKTQADIVNRGQQAVFTLTDFAVIDFFPLSNNGGPSIPVTPSLSTLKIIKM